MRKLVIVGLVFFLGYFTSHSQDDVEDKETVKSNPNRTIKIVKVKENIYMFQGKGGNIGVFIGEDGVFMIDDQFAEATPEILTLVKNLSDKPVQFLINTHHHGDHTGGNKNMNDNGIVIYSHDNVRKHLLEGVIQKAGKKQNAAIKEKLAKLEMNDKMDKEKVRTEVNKNVMDISHFTNKDNIFPMITFSDEITFFYNGEEIIVFHVQNAHTDGDVIVYFTKNNVIHTGDTFFNGRYPFIDFNSGGSLQGSIDAIDKILMIADEKTIIIPGHGKLASINDLRITRSMLTFFWKRITNFIVNKKTEDEVVNMKELTKEYDAKGFGDGFISTDKFIRTIYKDVIKDLGPIDNRTMEERLNDKLKDDENKNKNKG